MKTKIKEYGLSIFGIIVMISSIAFVDGKSKIQRCQGIEIDLNEYEEQVYISSDLIENFITKNGSEPIIGKMFSSINLADLEQQVKALKQVEFCEAYGDLQGILHLKVKPFIPYARIVSTTPMNNRYLNKEGTFFPLSQHHSARVILLSGSYFNDKANLTTAEDQHLFELIHTIKDDAFWNAQIAQMEVARNGEIKLVPVLGNHIVEFGIAENYASKLNKLKVFYKQILSVDGWDTFTKVKVQYANQIVCE